MALPAILDCFSYGSQDSMWVRFAVRRWLRDSMPTALRIGRYRFVFFSNESNEPPHIHVKASGDEAKFWLDPVQFAANYGFNIREINEIERLVHEHQEYLLEAWHEHLG
jgi:Domain of unknown function (DUF4160)